MFRTTSPLPASDMAASEGTEEIEVLWRNIALPEDDEFYDGPEAQTNHTNKGWRKAAELAPFQTDTIWEKDMSIPMRDGV